MLSEYGFYEAIDYTTSRLNYGEKSKPVKTYMAHHQGLILLAINNYINNNVLVNRFSKNPEISAVDILLQERMQEKAIITKEKKEKIEKQKQKKYENYIETKYTVTEEILNNSNTISNGNYTICLRDTGEGFSKYNNIYITRFKQTADYKQGIIFFVKNIRNKKIWTNMPIDQNQHQYSINFAPNITKYTRREENIETVTKVVIAPDDNVEIRRLEIKNTGIEEETLEISNYLEPVLSKPEQDYAHMAFNNLFLTFENINNKDILIKRKKRIPQEEDIFLGTTLYTENEFIGDFEYEIDKEKILGKKVNQIPEIIKESKPYSKNIGLVTDPALSMKKTIKILPNQTIILDFIMTVSNTKEETLVLLQKYKNTNFVSKIIELSKAKAEAETVYLGLNGESIKKYQKMLSYLIFQNPMKQITLQEIPKQIYSQSKLWKYGISGDLPILLVKIKDINDIYIIADILKAYEFFRSKNINIDLVILNQEVNSYEQYIKYEIENEIQNKQLGYLKNIFGGIFVLDLNQIPKEDINLLEFRANLLLDSNKGNIDIQIKELEEEYLKTFSNFIDKKKEYVIVDYNPNLLITDTDMINLKYYNDYGGFSEDGKEYNIKISKNNKLPTVWSMILANEEFGTLTTQNLGGFTWHKNSRLNRVSAWVNNPVYDIPSEIIYLKDKENEKIWTLSDNINLNDNEIYITYGFGYAKYKTINNNILQELEMFVPRNDSIKINILRLKNLDDKKRNLKLIYYIKPVIGEDEIKTNGYITVQKESNIVFIKNLYKDSFKKYTTYISSNENISSYTGNKESFIGNKSITNPEGLYKKELDNNSGLGQNSCTAVQIDIELESYESKNIILMLGEDEELKIKDIVCKYSKIENCITELNETKKFWYELTSKIQIKTPLESMNIILNRMGNIPNNSI